MRMAILALSTLLAVGCMSSIVAYRREMTSPSGQTKLDIVGMSDVGRSYAGVNNKKAEVYIYEMSPGSTNYHLAWKRTVSVANIGDMQVQTEWKNDQQVRLLFYDYGSMDIYSAKQQGVPMKFVAELCIGKTSGKWGVSGGRGVASQ